MTSVTLQGVIRCPLPLTNETCPWTQKLQGWMAEVPEPQRPLLSLGKLEINISLSSNDQRPRLHKKSIWIYGFFWYRRVTCLWEDRGAGRMRTRLWPPLFFPTSLSSRGALLLSLCPSLAPRTATRTAASDNFNGCIPLLSCLVLGITRSHVLPQFLCLWAPSRPFLLSVSMLSSRTIHPG